MSSITPMPHIRHAVATPSGTMIFGYELSLVTMDAVPCAFARAAPQYHRATT